MLARPAQEISLADIFRAVDGLGLIAHNIGYRAGNGARAM